MLFALLFILGWLMPSMGPGRTVNAASPEPKATIRSAVQKDEPPFYIDIEAQLLSRLHRPSNHAMKPAQSPLRPSTNRPIRRQSPRQHMKLSTGQAIFQTRNPSSSTSSLHPAPRNMDASLPGTTASAGSLHSSSVFSTSSSSSSSSSSSALSSSPSISGFIPMRGKDK